MTADPPTIVRVTADTAPRVVRIPTPGPSRIIRVETPGIPGPPGAPAPTAGFGQITYTERTVDENDLFAPNERKQIIFSPPATVVQDFLRSPFAGMVMFEDSVLRGRAFGDMTIGIINLIVKSKQASGFVTMDVDVGSSLGPTGSFSTILTKAAGVPERVTLPFYLQTLTNMLANGARFYLTASVPLEVTSESVLGIPISAGPAT